MKKQFKRMTALLLTVIMMLAVIPAMASTYADIEGHWAEFDINWALSHGYLPPTSATTFSPSQPTTRAEYITALAKVMGANVDAYTQSSFTDVPNSHPSMPYIQWGAAHGIVDGMGNNRFEPNGQITREQMATMMYRSAIFLGKGPAPGSAWMVQLLYADVADIRDWAIEGVTFCFMNNVMGGMPGNMFYPRGNVTKAEASSILFRFDANIVAGTVPPPVPIAGMIPDAYKSAVSVNAFVSLWSQREDGSDFFGYKNFSSTTKVFTDILAAIDTKTLSLATNAGNWMADFIFIGAGTSRVGYEFKFTATNELLLRTPDSGDIRHVNLTSQEYNSLKHYIEQVRLDNFAHLTNPARPTFNVPAGYSARVNAFNTLWQTTDDGADFHSAMNFAPGSSVYTRIENILRGKVLLPTNNTGNWFPDFSFVPSGATGGLDFRFYSNYELIHRASNGQLYRVDLTQNEFNTLKDYIGQVRYDNWEHLKPVYPNPQFIIPGGHIAVLEAYTHFMHATDGTDRIGSTNFAPGTTAYNQIAGYVNGRELKAISNIAPNFMPDFSFAAPGSLGDRYDFYMTYDHRLVLRTPGGEVFKVDITQANYFALRETIWDLRYDYFDMDEKYLDPTIILPANYNFRLNGFATVYQSAGDGSDFIGNVDFPVTSPEYRHMADLLNGKELMIVANTGNWFADFAFVTSAGGVGPQFYFSQETLLIRPMGTTHIFRVDLTPSEFSGLLSYIGDLRINRFPVTP